MLSFRCLDFTRSMRSPCDDKEEQFNEVTHFLDGSAIYGSTQVPLHLGHKQRCTQGKKKEQGE